MFTQLLTLSLSSLPNWDGESIKKRQLKLSEIASKVWIIK
jgi:hypothetical protein